MASPTSTPSDPDRPDRERRPRRSGPVARVGRAARPIAVASLVALSSTGVGLPVAPAAAAERVQQRLIADGYLEAEHGTGEYDPRTGAALARWQAAHGLDAHGLVDDVTAEELLGAHHRPVPRPPDVHP
ncbi:MAG: peptidoglycan-binding protein [Solirubrobacteraceae bacterium]|nr:peptidoglycan-binding protein [Solirubrobacteraceae bacterium]